MHELRLESPNRPLDWRWKRALTAEELPLSRARDDDWVWRARRFQLAYRACTTKAQFYELAWSFGPIHDAYRTYETRIPGFQPAVDQDQDLRPELEARLLAGQPAEDIAKRLAITKPAVEAYSELFFHVHDRLEARSWVAHAVFGVGAWQGLHPREYEVFWKLMAHVLGVGALEWYIAMEKQPEPQAGKYRSRVDDEVRDEVSRKSWISAKTLNINSHTQVAVLELWGKVKERESLAGDDPQSSILDHVRGVLEAVTWSPAAVPVISDSKEIAALPAAELRTSELLALTAGEGNSPVVEDLRFPERPRHDAATVRG